NLGSVSTIQSETISKHLVLGFNPSTDQLPRNIQETESIKTLQIILL
ncbi:unnamed protein product, partial [Allacma fusca]